MMCRSLCIDNNYILKKQKNIYTYTQTCKPTMFTHVISTMGCFLKAALVVFTGPPLETGSEGQVLKRVPNAAHGA